MLKRTHGLLQAAGILNPTVAIDHALENVRELDDGYGPQRLVTLAAYALRINLLQWLEQYRLEREHERKLWQQREHVQVHQHELHACTPTAAAMSM